MELTTHLHLEARLRTVEPYLHSPVFLQDVMLNCRDKYRDNFTFTLTLDLRKIVQDICEGIRSICPLASSDSDIKEGLLD
jgi:hypothetical protein